MNATTSQNKVTTTVNKKKYINDIATAEKISEIMDEELGETDYFTGPVRVTVAINDPNGLGSTLGTTIVYKLLRGTKTSYSTNNWMLVDSSQIQPAVSSSTEEKAEDPYTNPPQCYHCDMDGSVCFATAHSDICEINEEESDNQKESAPAVFGYRWHVTNVQVDDGSEGEILSFWDYNNKWALKPFNAVIGVEATNCPEDTVTCTATCGCDPCGVLGYAMDSWQCTASNMKYRIVQVTSNLTCYECYYL